MSVSIDMHRLKSVEAGGSIGRIAWVTFECEDGSNFSAFMDYEIALAIEKAYAEAIESQKVGEA